MQNVTQSILGGWKQELPCHPYDTFQEELIIVNGMILKKSRMVVPQSLRQEMSCIYESHLGIVKCRSHGRQHLCWPNMNEDITREVDR